VTGALKRKDKKIGKGDRFWERGELKPTEYFQTAPQSFPRGGWVAGRCTQKKKIIGEGREERKKYPAGKDRKGLKAHIMSKKHFTDGREEKNIEEHKQKTGRGGKRRGEWDKLQKRCRL